MEISGVTLYNLRSALVIDGLATLSSGLRFTELRRCMQEQAVFWGGKLFWALVYVAAPLLLSGHSWGRLFAVWALSQAITGWILAFMFQV